LLGWEATVDLAQGMALTIAAFKQACARVEDAAWNKHDH
jgi:hypothetical protein